MQPLRWSTAVQQRCLRGRKLWRNCSAALPVLAVAAAGRGPRRLCAAPWSTSSSTSRSPSGVSTARLKNLTPPRSLMPAMSTPFLPPAAGTQRHDAAPERRQQSICAARPAPRCTALPQRCECGGWLPRDRDGGVAAPGRSMHAGAAGIQQVPMRCCCTALRQPRCALWSLRRRGQCCPVLHARWRTPAAARCSLPRTLLDGGLLELGVDGHLGFGWCWCLLLAGVLGAEASWQAGRGRERED